MTEAELFKGAVVIVPDRLFYVALRAPPPRGRSTMHFFSVDDELTYYNFYLDFGELRCLGCWAWVEGGAG
jgi:hypothetical protein